MKSLTGKIQKKKKKDKEKKRKMRQINLKKNPKRNKTKKNSPNETKYDYCIKFSNKVMAVFLCVFLFYFFLGGAVTS